MAKHITLPQFDKAWKKLKELYVAKEAGKGLSANDFDDAAKSKLDSVAEGAEKNVIKAVKVNGEALAVAEDGSVDVVVAQVAMEDATDEEVDAVLAGTYQG